MKLHEVTLSGIFAYEDETRINLSRTTPEKNLILVWGRNGRGKTSFINALKLLFAGIEQERWRRVGFPPQILPPGQFVLGDGDHWMGVINRRTRRSAESKGESATASVEATWIVDGRVVIARREFSTTATGSFVEHLFLIEDGVRLTGVAATDRLADYLPPDYVGFFFFDGEDIKSLAETAERKSIDFDQLLRLSFVGELEKELKEAALERGRRSLRREERNELSEIRRRLADAEEACKEARDLLEAEEERILILQGRLSRAVTVKENLSTGASEAQRKELEEAKKRLDKNIKRATGEIVAGSFPTTAPMLANLPMVSAAIEQLDKRLESDGAAEQRTISRIARSIPRWIVEMALPLPIEEQDRLSRSLVERVEQSVTRPTGNGIFDTLELDRAIRVRTMLAKFTAGGADIRQAQVALLLALHRNLVEFDEIEEKLMRLRVGSEANLDRYRETERQIRELDAQIDEAQVQKGMQTQRLTTATSDLERFQARRDELNALAQRAMRDEREARYIDRITETLAEARERLRMEARDEVQDLLNKRFKELVYDHGLINKIVIDDSYTLNFFDGAERAVGRASLSSGLKQLAATALLWSMMEAAGYEMPVIIDTPLGRIDRENQDNMLARYFPKLSQQVILLPTTAEIDERKFGLIEARVADQYSIDNRTGESASILSGRLRENPFG